MVALTQRRRSEKPKKGSDTDIADLDTIGYAASIAQDADLVLYIHKTMQEGDIYRKKVTICKNKKRKTKKLKGKNKRRHTRNKKGGRTKRR
jgi:hypothetical protein